jgi:uncharacterized protein involved in outer membrane biogenesis
MKKWLMRGALAAVILVVLLVIGVFMFLNDIVKKGVETVGPKLTKTDVRLASSQISPLSGSGRMTGFLVGNPEGYKTDSAIKIGDVKVDVDVGTLLSDTIIVEEINIQGPEITFEGGLRGNNLSKLLDNLEASTGADKEKPEPEDSAVAGKKFVAKDIVIQGGKIHVNITGLGATTTTIAMPDIHLQNVGSDGSGITLAQLSKEILEPLIKTSLKASIEAIGKLGNDVTRLGKDITGMGKETADNAEKTVKEIKDLFKKK